MYQENGHATRINEDIGHDGPGIVEVYWLSKSIPVDTLQGVKTESLKDSFVRLLSFRSFDDNQCYQDNSTPEAGARKLQMHRARVDGE